MSHLAVWGEAVASGALGRWSPSLLLYRGREVGDLMSVVVFVEGDGMVGFEVDDRSSMVVPVCVASETLGHSSCGNFGKEGAGGRCAGAAEKEFVRIG